MNFTVQARVTRQVRSKEGFYLLVNGKRLHFKRRADAIAGIESLLSMQRFQIVTVRQFTEAQRSRIAKAMDNYAAKVEASYGQS